jgi:hypothetical protein
MEDGVGRFFRAEPLGVGDRRRSLRWLVRLLLPGKALYEAEPGALVQLLAIAAATLVDGAAQVHFDEARQGAARHLAVGAAVGGGCQKHGDSVPSEEAGEEDQDSIEPLPLFLVVYRPRCENLPECVRVQHLDRLAPLGEPCRQDAGQGRLT